MDWKNIYAAINRAIGYQIGIGPLDFSLFKLLLFIVLLTTSIRLARRIANVWLGGALARLPLEAAAKNRVQYIIRYALLISGFLATLAILGINLSIFKVLLDIINFPLFKIGQAQISIASLALFLVLIVGFSYASRLLSSLLVSRGLSRVRMDEGTKYVLKRVTEYVLIAIGTIIAFQSIGINLSGLAVIFGLLSVGIGFGLQNIASNFISGIILLFERPIQVGDRITVGETLGDVEEINIRSTTIRSLDNISIIVPNNEFIEGRVTNWSHGDLKIRMNIKVGVSYDSDIEVVFTALKETAAENPKVLRKPAPEVLLLEFGDSSWNMELRVWIADPKDYYRILSEINCAIVHKFRKYGIEIPYPQQDVHVRSPLPIPFEPGKN